MGDSTGCIAKKLPRAYVFHGALSLALCLLAPLQLSGQSCTSAVCNAATANESDVLAALPSNTNSNSIVVVNIPSGSATWTSALNYSVPSAVTNLTIQGATTVNCTGTAGQSSWACPATDSTTITDGFTPNGQNQLIQIATGSSSTLFRWTGTTFKTAANTAKNNAMLVIQGNSHNVRLDHNHFNENGQNNSMVQVQGDTAGVADHNLADLGGNSNVGNWFRNFASSDGVGDAAWNSPTPWGTFGFWYLESDVINGGSPTDCYNGAVLAVRYSTLNNIFVAALHGTKNDAGRGRSCRATEFYHNYMSGSTNANAVIGQNGGTSMLWGNNIASGYNNFNAPGAPRNINLLGVDSGTTPWGGMAGTTVRTTFSQAGTDPYDGNSSTSTGYPVLDGVGRGQGNLLTGTPASPLAWPSQMLEPEYMFMNTEAAASGGYINDVSSQVNRDIFADCNGKTFAGVTCSSFNGTQGTGFGLLSARPSTCTAGPGGTYGASPTGSYGVGYWATDANSGNGELYVCTATNTWTAVYQPAVYPHPLAGGSTTYTLSTATAGTGSGSISGCAGSYAPGVSYSCTVTPSAGSTLTSVSGCGGSGTTTFTGSMPASNCTVTATFTLNNYTFAVSQTGTGSGTVGNGSNCTNGTKTYGTSITCVETPAAGSSFAGWSGTLGCTGTGACSGTLTANSTVIATFQAIAATPAFSPAGGPFTGTLFVSLSDSTPGAVIHYTTDGSTPTSGSTTYSSPISITATTTIKAIAIASGYANSAVGSQTYTLSTFFTLSTATAGTGSGTITGGSCAGSYAAGTAYSCIVTPAAGSTITSVSGCGGSGTTTYTGTMPSSNCTVTATFQGTAATPTASPVAGAYGGTQSVTLSDSTPSSSIFYTTDGSTPTPSSTPYTGAISVAVSTTIKAIATASGWANSGILTAAYTINGTVATPTFSPVAGTYGSPQNVSMSTSTSGAYICWTTNGTTPVPDGAGGCSTGTIYGAPLNISASVTVKAVAGKAGWTNSATASAPYTINGTLSAVTFTPLGGSYTTTQTVSLFAGAPPSVVASMTETNNTNSSLGAAPHRNVYTNCIQTCSGGSPGPTPFGSLWCSASAKSTWSASCPSYASHGVVSATTTNSGISVLENGNGAGGSDSAPTVTATYAGSGTGCGVGTSVASTYISGLTLPGEVSNSQSVFGLTTASSGFNTSMLAVTKYNQNHDSGNWYVREDCAKPNTTSGGGQHYEWDTNYNDTHGTYFGWGMDFNFPTGKLRVAPQGASWINVRLCPIGGGACLTTLSWPSTDYMYSQMYGHYNLGCSPSSSSACAFYDVACIQFWNGGSPRAALQCYNMLNDATGNPLGYIPISKTIWTHPQDAPQHQWDADGSSLNLTATVEFSNTLYFTNTGSPTICYTLDNSTPTTDGNGNCTGSTLRYSAPLTITATTTVKAKATQSGWADSVVTTQNYTITGQLATPTFSISPGTYTHPVLPQILGPSGATIYYTLDGSTPTTSSPVYTGAQIPIYTTTTVKALAVEAGWINSNIATGVYTITYPSANVMISGQALISGKVQNP